VGNGLSSGLVMTIGQDAAPADARSRFIGLFKVATDSGIFAGPMAVGLLWRAFSIDVAAYTVAASSAVAAVWYALSGPESLARSESRALRHRRLVELNEGSVVEEVSPSLVAGIPSDAKGIHVAADDESPAPSAAATYSQRV
jgi:hypothetical protein